MTMLCLIFLYIKNGIFVFILIYDPLIFFFFLVLSAWWMAFVQRAETTNILCGGSNGY